MRTLLKPQWILLTVCLPILLFLFMNYNELKPVWSMFTAEQTNLILCFAGIFSGLILINLSYGIFLMITKRRMSMPAAAVNLIALVSVLYFFYAKTLSMGFSTLPGWMISDNTFLFGMMFLSPACLYNLIVLSIYSIALSSNKKAWRPLVIFFSIPLTLLISYWIIEYINPTISFHFNENFIILIFLSGILIMLYFLITGVLLLSRKISDNQNSSLIWKTIIALILPLTGLMLSNGVFSNSDNHREFSIFGEFSNGWFYILTIVNAVLLCLPVFKNKVLQYFIFLLKSLTFAFTLYFFIIFLPLLPLSIVAVLIYGAGLLMQAPLALFIIHVQSLHKDFRRLKRAFSKPLLYLTSVLAFMIIPTLIIITFVRERVVLRQALEFVYNPDYSKDCPVTPQQMEKTLDMLDFHNGRNRSIYGQSLPLISGLYQTIALDHLTLSNEKFNTLQKVYTAKTIENKPLLNFEKDSVRITSIHTESHFDKTQNVWISKLDLDLTNFDNRRLQSEYSTVFKLPDACFISDYYLYVNGQKKKGLMCEKKSALWIYSEIRDYRRDPGILFYTSGNKIAFNVYPFGEKETRKTGFELIHKEPFCLTIDDRKIQLGDSAEAGLAKVSEDQSLLTYVSSSEKSKLKKIARTPYYHFIIDVSAGRKGEAENYLRSIRSLLACKLIPEKQVRISLTNCNVREASWNEAFEDTLKNCEYQGGFFADRAIRKILIDQISYPCNSYPIIVVVTPQFADAVINGDFNDLKAGFPENDYFYQLTPKGDLFMRSLSDNPQEILSYCKTIKTDSVYELSRPAFPNHYLPDNTEGNFVYDSPGEIPAVSGEANQKTWNAGVYQQAAWMALQLHPEKTEEHWKRLAESGLQSGIMNHFTSYIVVETEAQEQVLLKKQKSVLSGHNSLDAGESTGMPEGDLLITLGLLLAMIFLPRLFRKRIKAM